MRFAFSIAVFVLITVSSVFTYANWGGSGNMGSFGAGHLEAIGTKEVELLNEDLRIDLLQRSRSSDR